MTKELLKKWHELGNVEIPKLLLLEYKQLKLNEVELVLLLQMIQFEKEENHFPTPELLSSRMSIGSFECSEILGKLIRSGMLKLISSQDSNNIMEEAYSVEPLWDKLFELFLKKSTIETKKVEALDEQNVFEVFEREFGRLLSPYECETINFWLDQDKNTPELILHALKEAVISGKLNFKYIDRILFEWNKNNITTVAQATEMSKKFRQNQTVGKIRPETTSTVKKVVPTYNWVD